MASRNADSKYGLAIFKNPPWLDSKLLDYKILSDFPDSLIQEINYNLESVLSVDPLVSVVIPVWNEEANIIRTIFSLSKNFTTYPFEIIVVNNNSSDRTAAALDRLYIKSFFQEIQGCGPSRQLGQEMAKGKYILMGDADCFYPRDWIQEMVSALEMKGVACVYGKYSFLGTPYKPRWQFTIYEFLRDVMAELRHLKSPYLNAVGMSMGYVKEFGLQIRFVNFQIRGEDGRMCYALMNYGKIVHLRSRSARVWTLPRTLDKEGSLLKAVLARIVVEVLRIKDYFYRQPEHDTHTSKSYLPLAVKHFKKFWAVHKGSEKKENIK